MIVSSPRGVPVPPNLLSAVEIGRYRRDGFVVCRSVLKESDAARLRDVVTRLDFSEKTNADARHFMSLELTGLDEQFRDLVRDHRILGRVVPLVGPDVVVEHTKVSAQPLGTGGGVPWHQDFAFYPHTNCDVLAVMLWLDDSSLGNGCTRMIRGSHRHGVFDHTSADGVFLGSCADQQRWQGHESQVPLELQAGDISIHHCLTVHGSGANVTGTNRRAIVLNYRAADAYQLADMVFADTGLVVSGCYRERARCDAMTLPIPRFPESWKRGSHGSAWHQVGPLAGRLNTELGLNESGRA